LKNPLYCDRLQSLDLVTTGFSNGLLDAHRRERRVRGERPANRNRDSTTPSPDPSAIPSRLSAFSATSPVGSPLYAVRGYLFLRRSSPRILS